jgi:serine protease Do
MPLRSLITILSAACITASAHAASAPALADLRAERAVRDAALAAVAPAVVRIDTIGGIDPQAEPDNEEQERPAAVRLGDGPTTGVVWSADGYIVSSAFNFARAPSTIIVTLADGRQLVATLVGRDPLTRLALLRVPADDLQPPPRVGRAGLKLAESVGVAGFGHGTAAPAISWGIVSALHRINGLAFQLDAKTSPANYGGPVIDLEGRVLGICVPLAKEADVLAGTEWYDSGIGFAIPSDFVTERVNLMQQRGDVERGYAGIIPRDAWRVFSWEPEKTGFPEEGVPFAADPIGPAADAGLTADDVLIGIDDQPVDTAIAVRRALARKPAGATVTLTVIRDEEAIVTELELVSRAALEQWLANRAAQQAAEEAEAESEANAEQPEAPDPTPDPLPAEETE